MRKRLTIFAVPVLGMSAVVATAGTAAPAYASASAGAGGRAPTYRILDVAAVPDYPGGTGATAVNGSGQIVGYASRIYQASGFLWDNGYQQPLGANTMPVDVNENGQIAGNLAQRYNTLAFTWQDGTLTDLGYLDPVHIGGDTGNTYVEDLNEAGQIVGASQVDADGYYFWHAFRWQDGVMTDLGTLGGAESFARAVNDRGDVVGGADTSTGQRHAFLSTAGTVLDLGTLGGGYSEATDVNNRGQVVGVSAVASGEYHAFLWERGVMRDLGAVDGSYTAAAAYLTENGKVLVGSKGWYNSPVQAFVWERGSRTPVGGIDSSSLVAAVAINERGQVVGAAPTPSGSTHAFVAHRGTTTDLGTLAGPGSYATAVNNDGVVVGAADPASGPKHAVRWSPDR